MRFNAINVRPEGGGSGFPRNVGDFVSEFAMSYPIKQFITHRCENLVSWTRTHIPTVYTYPSLLSNNFPQLSTVNMRVVFINEVFVHHVLKDPSPIILWQQDTVQYSTKQCPELLFFCYAFGIRFVGVLSSLGTSHVSQPVDHA